MATTASAYIHHHLQHWQATVPGGWVINLDTILLSTGLAVLFWLIMRMVVLRFSIEKPTKTQIVVEELVVFVRQQVGGNLPPELLSSVGALALTVFAWVFLMNCMDLVPVDLLPVLAMALGSEYFRPVPTADLNVTFALSIGVMLVVYVHAFRANGILGWLRETLSQPFGWYLFPVNVIKHLITDLAKVISLSLRLFGNLYGGELIFILIAGLVPYALQAVPYWGWMTLHLLIVTLQAFIFMILSVIYIALARQGH
ncbi:MAG: F0F1 ATP synthase subunit A [Pseudomonadota bacterium]|nr:F0F1 ATP synthase subunit A [Pseudomonadota bacterium]MEC8461183.1 F0F1 ATP synthase subunit A [Pseudomonadota bacterium]